MSEAETTAPEDVNKAIQVAKAFLLQAFTGESIENLGLEEVKHSRGSIWDVTLGFNRRWEQPESLNAFLQAAAGTLRSRRTYKVVRVDLSGPSGVSIANYRDE